MVWKWSESETSKLTMVDMYYQFSNDKMEKILWQGGKSDRTISRYKGWVEPDNP